MLFQSGDKKTVAEEVLLNKGAGLPDGIHRITNNVRRDLIIALLAAIMVIDVTNAAMTLVEEAPKNVMLAVDLLLLGGVQSIQINQTSHNRPP